MLGLPEPTTLFERSGDGISPDTQYVTCTLYYYVHPMIRKDYRFYVLGRDMLALDILVRARTDTTSLHSLKSHVVCVCLGPFHNSWSRRRPRLKVNKFLPGISMCDVFPKTNHWVGLCTTYIYSE